MLEDLSWIPENGVHLDNDWNLVYPKEASHLDGIDDELRGLIDDHWAQFPPQHPMVNVCGGLLYLTLSIINYIGNGIVLYVFLKVKSLRTPSNMFIANLAFADLIQMICQGPPVFITCFKQRYWMWGAKGCTFYAFTGAFTGVAAIMSMVMIGYDRYNVIVKGLTGQKITTTKALLMIATVYVYALAITIAPLLGWGNYKLEGFLITCTYDFFTPGLNEKTFILFAYIFNFFFPMFLICHFYSSIVRAVFEHERNLRAQAKKMNVETLRSMSQTDVESSEFKVAKVAITAVVLWLCNWVPYAILCSLPTFGLISVLTPMVSTIPSLLTKTACCLNPVVFALSHPKFREAINREIPCFGSGEGISSGADKETVVQEAPTETC